ncbi:hypothetical protein RJ639_029850 [Escallonia herrerae]|uniref:Protein kinase domain-containing protein n=1 Tax=Escallonia herrerae TaxID=1293975 RepID=A0AA88X1N6_9ASTE|nr:hypothetical protein RJ639_029850 [Escallonia herrerae]
MQSSPSKPSPAVFFFLGGIVVLLVLLILIIIFWKIVKPAELRKLLACMKKHQGTNDYLSETLRSIRYFDFQTLKRATKNFDQRNLLGRGGFGPVYLGKLDGRLVAVKKLSLDKSQQGEPEFLAEVRMITSIQHKNLVRLLGCCSAGAQRLLVYEYMKNRSLDHIIYGAEVVAASLSCQRLLLQIYGGDVATITAKPFSDGRSRLICVEGKSKGDFAVLFANKGYTAPEYAIRGELSEKADIYSFGVLVLEIISLRKNTDLTLPSEMQYLPEYAWKLYERSKVLDLVDPNMREDGFVEKDVLHTIHVAFLCLQPHANLRPPMSEIVAMLTCKVEMVRTPLKPAFLDRRRRTDEKLYWETISEVFPSPLRSDSPSLTRAPNKGL